MMNSMWVGVRRADAWTKSEASRMKKLHGRKGNQIVYKHELIRKTCNMLMHCRHVNFQLKELEKFEDVMTGAFEGNMHSLTKIKKTAFYIHCK